MAYKQNRTLKVYEQSGYRYNPTPTITLKGKWLEELNFPAGTPIIVKCEDGVLTITRADFRISLFAFVQRLLHKLLIQFFFYFFYGRQTAL